MTFNFGAVGSSPTGLTNAPKAFQPNATSRRRRVPRPSPKTAAKCRRPPRGTARPRPARRPMFRAKLQQRCAGPTAGAWPARASGSHWSAAWGVTKFDPKRHSRQQCGLHPIKMACSHGLLRLAAFELHPSRNWRARQRCQRCGYPALLRWIRHMVVAPQSSAVAPTSSV
jgi:hypothetical protein